MTNFVDIRIISEERDAPVSNECKPWVRLVSAVVLYGGIMHIQYTLLFLKSMSGMLSVASASQHSEDEEKKSVKGFGTLSLHGRLFNHH